MNLSFVPPSVFETFNARHLSADQVARNFVPPADVFADLATRNNHLLIGPRGSGKTTLLKMLTLPALAQWENDKHDNILPQADFIGIFVPADRGWHVQLRDADHNIEQKISIGRIAFTTHVLSSFIQTLRDVRLLDGLGQKPVTQVPATLSPSDEAALVDELSAVWKLKPKIRSLGGLSIALRARLVELGSLREAARRTSDLNKLIEDRAPYADLNFKDCISHAIETYSVLTGEPDITWAFLFDEFEVAPSFIQREVLSSLRGESETRIIYKIALAPYNRNFIQNVSDIPAAPRHDFGVIDLWYPEKTKAYDFSEQLVKQLLSQHGLKIDRLRSVFGDSEFGFPEAHDIQPYEEDGRVLQAFESLSRMDDTFHAHLDRRKINLKQIALMTESERAEKIRKMRSVVITREYFLRTDKDIPDNFKGRSRKIKSIYTGHPTILALCEGNPRLLIGIITPLLRKLIRIRAAHDKKAISRSSQAAQIKSAANSFRSLLKTIPYHESETQGDRGLLRLLDRIGGFFFRKAVLERFSPQPPLSFTVDSSVDDVTLRALGRALNAGAIVHVPDPGADPILSSLRGKRFRLCYLLAAYYKLPIMLNTSVALSTIIGPFRQKTHIESSPALDLFNSIIESDDV